MSRKILSRPSLLAAVACSLVAASAALAQDRVLVTWTGRVDKEARITIRDTTITTSIVGGQPIKRAFFNVQDRLPAQDGTVRVELNAGRGDVDVVQQPSASNGYAAVLRIRDKSKGRDNYEVTAYWNPQRGEDRYSKAASARASADAKPTNTMHWSGLVDREVQIEWRGTDISTRPRSGATAREVHSSVTDGLPTHEARIELIVREGRGDVSIKQQPNSANGYTAIIRVRDPQTGYGRYDFDVNWR